MIHTFSKDFTATECHTLFEEIEEVVGNGNFKIAKVASNNPEFLALVPAEQRAEGEIHELSQIGDSWFVNHDQKPLGLTWSSVKDRYFFGIKEKIFKDIQLKPTRRILSSVL